MKDDDTCPVCDGAGSVLLDPRDPASVVECTACEDDRCTLRGAA